MNILSQLNSYVLRPQKKKQRKRASSKLLKIPGKSNRSDKEVISNCELFRSLKRAS